MDATGASCMVAEHPGVCDICGDMIRPGKDRICYLPEDDCWVHHRCAVDEGYVGEDA